MIRLVVEGPPRTKKNHQQIRINRRTGKHFVAQADTASAWEEIAVLQLRTQLHRAPLKSPFDGAVLLPYFTRPVNVRALVYRERAGRADLLNYLAAVSDALEAAGVVANDELVAGLDGSRMLIDRARPRVEITLEPLG